MTWPLSSSSFASLASKMGNLCALNDPENFWATSSGYDDTFVFHDCILLYALSSSCAKWAHELRVRLLHGLTFHNWLHKRYNVAAVESTVR